MTVMDADTYEARLRLEVALEKLEQVLADLERLRADPDDLAEPLARTVLLLARYVLATRQR
jgi:hypothetical protein